MTDFDATLADARTIAASVRQLSSLSAAGSTLRADMATVKADCDALIAAGDAVSDLLAHMSSALERLFNASDPNPTGLAYLPTGWTMRLVDDFAVLNLNLDTTLTDAGIVADPGFWGFSNLWYQNSTKPGLPGFGRDFAMNPLAASAPASHKRTNPIGLLEFTSAGLKFTARAPTSDELAAIPDLPIQGDSTPWVSAMLSNRGKFLVKPPFARITRVKLPPTSNHQFPAIWGLLDGAGTAVRYPGNQGSGVPQFEMDDMERFGRTNLNATLHLNKASGASTAPGFADYVPATDLSTVFIDIALICELNRITIKYVAMDGTVLHSSSTDDLGANPLDDATYLSTYLDFAHHMILNNSAGIPDSFGDAIKGPPSGTLTQNTMTVASVSWAMPSSNVSVPSTIPWPTTNTTLTWLAGFESGIIPDNTDPGPGPVRVADFGGTADEFAILGGGGKFSVSGDGLYLVGALAHAQVGSYRLLYGGRVAGAGTGYGFRPEILITVGDNGGVPWKDATANVSLNPTLPEAYAFAVAKVYSDYVSGTTAVNAAGGHPGLTVEMPGRATSNTFTFKGHGLADAQFAGLMGSDVANADLRFAVGITGTSTGATAQFKMGGVDRTLTLPQMTAPGDPWAVTVSFGTDGVSMWANGSDALSNAGTWPTSGTDSNGYFIGADGFNGNPAPLDRVFIHATSGGLRADNTTGKALAVHL